MTDDKPPSHWPITLTNGFAAVLNIFMPLGLVRILQPDQVGRYRIFFLYVTLSSGLFFTAGFSNGLYHWMGKYPETKPELRQSWTLCLGIILLCTALCLLFASPLGRFIKFGDMDLRALTLAMPFAMVAAFFEDLLIARGNIWAGSWYSSGFSVLRTGSILAAAWWSHRVETTFWAFLAVSVLRVLVGWKLLAKSGELIPLFSMEKSAPVLRYAVPVSFAALAGLIFGNADQMILSFRLKPADFAFYSIGCLTLPPLDILETSVNRVLIPRMARAFTVQDNAKIAALFSEAVAELWLFLLPATVGLVLFAKPIIVILFTERYASAAHYLRFYAFYYLFTSVSTNSVARARADGAWILKSTFVFAPLSLLLAFLATARWGAMGALFSVLATALAVRAYSLTYNRTRLDLPYSAFVPSRHILTQTGVALAAAAVALALRPLLGESRSWFFVAGPLFTAVYFGVTYAIFLKRSAAAPGPPHILQLAGKLGRGGEPEKLVNSLTQFLTRQERFRVTVAGYDSESPQSSVLTKFGTEDLPVTLWRKKDGFSPPTLFRIVRLILTENVSIVHAHGLGPLIYGSLAKILSLGRVRLIVTVHSLQDIRHNSRHRFYYNMFLRFPDRIVAVSDEIASGLQELGADPLRVKVVSDAAAASYSEFF